MNAVLDDVFGKDVPGDEEAPEPKSLRPSSISFPEDGTDNRPSVIGAGSSHNTFADCITLRDRIAALKRYHVNVIRICPMLMTAVIIFPDHKKDGGVHGQKDHSASSRKA